MRAYRADSRRRGERGRGVGTTSAKKVRGEPGDDPLVGEPEQAEKTRAADEPSVTCDFGARRGLLGVDVVRDVAVLTLRRPEKLNRRLPVRHRQPVPSFDRAPSPCRQAGTAR
ncbi:hypothetical protein DL991_37720 [Amycolatopsis sp. WAC 01375]|nr:hypothetical protein DL991_37720 [Amycolatopsis sp. WAC 01375]